MAKGLDINFLHYGIRKPDLDVIAELCKKHDLDFDWVQEEILKKYHEKRADVTEMDEPAVVGVVKKAIQKIR